MAKIIFDSEKELEDYICARIDEGNRCPISGDEVTAYRRQANLGTYGIADVLKFYVDNDNAEVTITVLEVKKEVADASAIMQVVRYAEGVKHFLRQNPDFFNYISSGFIRVRCEIAAPAIKTTDDTCFLLNCIPMLSAYEIVCDLDIGMTGERVGRGWVMTNAEFGSLPELSEKMCEMVERSEIEWPEIKGFVYGPLETGGA